MNDKFSKEIEILKKNQTEILAVKGTMNQIKPSDEHVFNRVGYADNRISHLEEKVSGLKHSNNIKGKK